MITTILVPLIWSAIITLWMPDYFVLKAILHLVAFLALSVLAELSVAFALKRDQSKAAQVVSQEVYVVSGEIRTLREQHRDLIGDLRREIEYQDEVFRSAFERLGVDLPGRRFSVSPKPIVWNFRVPELTVTVTRGEASGCGFVGCSNALGGGLKETVWGKPDHQ